MDGHARSAVVSTGMDFLLVECSVAELIKRTRVRPFISRGVLTMKYATTYQIMLLPTLDILVGGYSLREAAAWIEVYNLIFQEESIRAVIGEEMLRTADPSGT